MAWLTAAVRGVLVLETFLLPFTLLFYSRPVPFFFHFLCLVNWPCGAAKLKVVKVELN